MRGRAQAIGVAILGSVVMLPIASQATLSLVSLRKGFNEGLWVTMAALLPLILFVSMGMDTWTGKFFAVELFAVTFIASVVLRETMSLEITILAATAASAVAAFVFVGLFPSVVDELSKGLTTVLQNIEQDQVEVPAELKVAFTNYTGLKASGLIAFVYSWTVMMGVFAGRWLQAILYNPGGFQSEFHGMRVNIPVMLTCVVAAVFFEFQGHDYMYWVHFSLTPLVMVGLGMVHFIAKNTKLGFAGLSVFYLSIALFPPLTMIVTLFLGLTDPLVNYRARFKFKQ